MSKSRTPLYLYDIVNVELANVPYDEREALRIAEWAELAAIYPITRFSVCHLDLPLKAVRAHALAIRAAKNDFFVEMIFAEDADRDTVAAMLGVKSVNTPPKPSPKTI